MQPSSIDVHINHPTSSHLSCRTRYSKLSLVLCRIKRVHGRQRHGFWILIAPVAGRSSHQELWRIFSMSEDSFLLNRTCLITPQSLSSKFFSIFLFPSRSTTFVDSPLCLMFWGNDSVLIIYNSGGECFTFCYAVGKGERIVHLLRASLSANLVVRTGCTLRIYWSCIWSSLSVCLGIINIRIFRFTCFPADDDRIIWYARVVIRVS